MNNVIYLEIWRTPDGQSWRASKQEYNNHEYSNWTECERAHSRDRWEYYWTFRGKKVTAIVCSMEVFSKEEALKISDLCVNMKGVKAWRIDLNR